MSRTRTPFQTFLRTVVLLAVGLQMTAIPAVGRVAVVLDESACPPSACADLSACEPAAACEPTGDACSPADLSLKESRAALPGCAGDPYRCETCTGCPIWCSTPFLNVPADGRILPFGDVLLRLSTAVDGAESLALDLLTPPPKSA